MIELIQKRLDSYKLSNPVLQEQATKEILQEIALYALWRADFFKVAAFQGGTSLRILHGLPRFSEDLDFILKQKDKNFEWSKYLGKLLSCFQEFGLKPEVLSKGKLDNRIQKAIIKDNSIINQLNLSFYGSQSNQKLKIKLEIDIDPPIGSSYDYTYLDFPLDFEVCQQDLGSNFSLKIHALLCRKFVKGRDWYDFNWYIKQKVSPNLPLLKNALIQYGPWQNQNHLTINLNWLKKALLSKIESINWRNASDDVERFLNTPDRISLGLWNNAFFNSKVEQLGRAKQDLK